VERFNPVTLFRKLNTDDKLWATVAFMLILCVSVIVFKGDPVIPPPADPDYRPNPEFTVVTYTSYPQMSKTSDTVFLDSPYLALDINNQIFEWGSRLNYIHVVHGVGMDAEGKYAMAYGGTDTEGVIIVVDQTNGSEVFRYEYPGGMITAATMSDDGSRIFFGADSQFLGGNTILGAIDSASHEPFFIYETTKQTVASDGLGAFRSVAISADGRYAVAGYWDMEGDEDGEIFQFDLDRPALSWTTYWYDNISAVSVSDDGLTVVAGTPDGKLYFWNFAPFAMMPQWSAEWETNVSVLNIAVSGNGETVVASGGQLGGNFPGYAAVYDTATGEMEWDFTGTEREHDTIMQAAVSDNGQIVYLENMQGDIKAFTDGQIYYDNHWEWIKRAEYIHWKQEQDKLSIELSPIANPGNPYLQLETYEPVVGTLVLLLACWKIGGWTRRPT
tara:strand:- start:169 stop:1500 length:1332 start_codon:yes stop_codon:yes gene_type:complete